MLITLAEKNQKLDLHLDIVKINLGKSNLTNLSYYLKFQLIKKLKYEYIFIKTLLYLVLLIQFN